MATPDATSPSVAAARPTHDGKRLRRAGLALVPLLALAVALWAVRLPYFVLQPGPPQEVEPLIQVTGHPTFQSQSVLLLTDVSFFQPNAFEAVAAAVNPDDHVVRQDELLPPGQN